MVKKPDDDPRVYAALAMPNAALENGGVEILRVGVIEDELHVQARRAFKDPKLWGAVLADVAKRIAAVYAAETKRTREDAFAAILAAFAADIGSGPNEPAARRSRKRNPAAKRKPAKKAASTRTSRAKTKRRR
jgi:hypothetical protein